MNEQALRETTAEIREDIGRTRMGLDFMIDALEGRLSMGNLIDEAVGMLRGRGAGTEAPIGSLIRDHPGPAALITAGVVWLAIENRRGSRRREEPVAVKRVPAKRAPGTAPVKKSTSGTRTTGTRKRTEDSR